jgi:hypothetical protein
MVKIYIKITLCDIQLDMIYAGMIYILETTGITKSLLHKVLVLKIGAAKIR